MYKYNCIYISMQYACNKLHFILDWNEVKISNIFVLNVSEANMKKQATHNKHTIAMSHSSNDVHIVFFFFMNNVYFVLPPTCIYICTILICQRRNFICFFSFLFKNNIHTKVHTTAYSIYTT